MQFSSKSMLSTAALLLALPVATFAGTITFTGQILPPTCAFSAEQDSQGARSSVSFAVSQCATVGEAFAADMSLRGRQMRDAESAGVSQTSVKLVRMGEKGEEAIDVTGQPLNLPELSIPADQQSVNLRYAFVAPQEVVAQGSTVLEYTVNYR